MERERFVPFHIESCMFQIGCRHQFILYWDPVGAKQQQQTHYRSLKMSVNGVSTVLGLTYLVITILHSSSCTKQNNWLPWYAKIHIRKENYRFQITRYCKLENMPQHIIGCWKRDFDKLLLTNCKNKYLYEPIHGPAGQCADNPPNPDCFNGYHPTLLELMVRVDWRPRPPMWQSYGCDPDSDPAWKPGTVPSTAQKRVPEASTCYTV
jgi:hypothetical protein